MERIDFLKLEKELKIAIFYNIALELSENKRDLKIFILSFFLKMHRIGISRILKDAEYSKILFNLKQMRVSESEFEDVEDSIKEADWKKKEIDYNNPNEHCRNFAKQFIESQTSKSGKQSRKKPYKLFLKGKLEDPSGQRGFFFDFIFQCTKNIKK
jgi:hypothetical protein